MLFNQNREEMRQFFIDVWNKREQSLPLTPLETIIADTVAIHPEYHSELLDPDKVLDKDYAAESGQSNPFLHMGLHIGLREQVQANHPFGIKDIYIKYMEQFQDAHEAEHQMIECLANSLWQAQSNNTMPNDADYLACLNKQLIKK